MPAPGKAASTPVGTAPMQTRLPCSSNALIWTAAKTESNPEIGSNTSAELTTAGEGVVDAFHPYGRVGRLAGKPVELLERTDDFLRAVLAEREGLLTIKVRQVLSIKDK